jgi:Ca2+-binding EF-hand superfamily protein
MRLVTIIILILLFFAGCSSYRIVPPPTNWDANGDDILDRYEFLKGYIKSDYFKKWSRSQKPIMLEQFSQTIFSILDHDKDDNLGEREFRSGINHFFLRTRISFGQWDEDSNGIVDKTEFRRHAQDPDFSSLWDGNGDNTVTDREMAGGMFQVCDRDGNAEINVLEFNIWNANR